MVYMRVITTSDKKEVVEKIAEVLVKKKFAVCAQIRFSQKAYTSEKGRSSTPRSIFA